VRLRPVLFVSIFVFIRDFLQGSPAENSIMADKG
jgi:hypothetical protein